MKNLLKGYKTQRVLRQLSDQTIDCLVEKFCNDPKPDLKSIRKDKKKREILQAITESIADHPFCIFALRVAYFFYKERNAFTGLRPFFSCNNVQVDWTKIDDGKSEAEQTVLLYMEQEKLVSDFFIICLHTHQSGIYCSCRSDYTEGAVQVPDAKTLEALKAKLLSTIHRDRGSRYSNARSFSHDGKMFLMLEFDDLPSYQREYENGENKPVDKYPRLVLGLAYVFDTRNNTIDTIADTPEIRLQMHQVCAEVIYGKKEIDAHPPKNEIFCLQTLLDKVLEGKPLSAVMSDTGVKQAFISSLQVRRTKPPFWKVTLDIQIPKNHLEQGEPRDWVKEIQDCANGLIKLIDPFHRSYMEATRAVMFVVYWDEAKEKDVSMKVTVNSSGGTNLGHDETDENIKQFFREIKLLKSCGDEK